LIIRVGFKLQPVLVSSVDCKLCPCLLSNLGDFHEIFPVPNLFSLPERQVPLASVAFAISFLTNIQIHQLWEVQISLRHWQ